MTQEMTNLEQINEHIAQMESWLFDGDMADDDPDKAAQHYANAERARKSAQLYALAAIAEAAARIASAMETGDNRDGLAESVTIWGSGQ